MKIDINEVWRLLETKKYINKPDMKEIEWTYLGEVIPVPDWMIEEFRFMGVNNITFVEWFYNDLVRLANGKTLTPEEVFDENKHFKVLNFVKEENEETTR